MKLILYSARALAAAFAVAMLLACPLAARADITITNVHAQTKTGPAPQKKVSVDIVYNITQVPAEGAVLSLEADLTDSKGVQSTITPLDAEITGDYGTVTTDGDKTIHWDAEQTLVRMGIQGEYLCIINLKVAGNGNPTVARLSISSYKPSGWNYFDAGTIEFSNLQRTNGFTALCTPVQGSDWQNTVEAGAKFYRGDVTAFPLYRGRNSGDQFKGACDIIGCSAFLAVKDQGTPKEKVWANFSKSFEQTHSVNGTSITARYEFQFRYTNDKTANTKTLVVGNAGKPGQQIFSELNQGENYTFELVAGPALKVRSNAFNLAVVRREFKYSYKGTPVMIFKATGDDGKFTTSEAKANTLTLSGDNMDINSWLKFQGTFSIDTTTDHAKFTSSGTWSTSGGKLLYSGQFDGTLDTSIAVNTGFPLPVVNPAWNLAGVAIGLENIRFAGGVDQASGLVLDIRVLVKEMATGCKFDLAKPVAGLGSIAGIEFKGVKLSDDGWDITGFQVTNTGMNADPNFCIKNFSGTYDRAASKITAELVASNIMFDEMGGGFVLLNGYPQSFHLLMKLQQAKGVAIPIPNNVTYPAVWTGFDVGMSGLQKGPLTISGTVFFANREDWKNVGAFNELAKLVGANDFKLFELEGNATGSVAGELSISGKGRFLGKGDAWAVQLRGKADMVSNSGSLMFGVEGGVDVVNLGGDQWFLTGTERGSVTFVPTFNMTQSITGDAYIPDLFKNNPIFTAINKRFGLPRKLASIRAVQSNLSLAFDAVFPDFGTLGVAVDLSKNPFTDPLSFIRVQTGATILPGKPMKHKGASILGASDTTYRTMATTASMQRVIIQLWGNPSAPVSFLVNPSGARITATTPDSSVIYLPPTTDDESALWIVKNPGAGTWKLATVAEKSGDSVHIWGLENKRSDFQVTTQSTGRNVTAQWDPTGAPSGSQVRFYLDNDDKNFDGIYIGGVAESAGSFSFALSDTLPECSYYVYGVRTDSGLVSEAYSATRHDNPKTWLVAPTNVHAEYRPSGEITVTWDASTDPNALQYEVRLTDASGLDSIFSTVGFTYTMTQFQASAPAAKQIWIRTVGENGLRGCWSQPASLTPAGVDEPVSGSYRASGLDLYIAPMPANNRTTVYANVPSSAILSFDLYDADGRLVMPVARGMYARGTARADLDASSLPNGIYFIHVTGDGVSASRKLVVQH